MSVPAAWLREPACGSYTVQGFGLSGRCVFCDRCVTLPVPRASSASALMQRSHPVAVHLEEVAQLLARMRTVRNRRAEDSVAARHIGTNLSGTAHSNRVSRTNGRAYP